MKKIFLLIFVFFGISANVFAESNRIVSGQSDAKIIIIAYESLTCSHCADFHKNIYPILKKNFIEKGLVQIEFKNFPLDIAALNASKIAHCKNDGNSKILHFLYENQIKWVKGKTVNELNENLKSVIKDSSFSLNFDKCINDTTLEDHILEDRIQGAKNSKQNPNIIIMGKNSKNHLLIKNIKYLEKLI